MDSSPQTPAAPHGQFATDRASALMLRYSKRRNLVVFGIAESSACATPEALAAHLQSLMFEDGGANKIRAPAPGPRPAHKPEHTNVAMDPAEVLRQAGVSVSKEFDLGPALPFTMGTAGSDSDFQDCASPKASASGLMGAFLG
ncbi:TPA: hypothetical protein ACH3X1_006832 [Trebouxia sp. C0004]